MLESNKKNDSISKNICKDILFEVFACIYVVLVVVFFWKSPVAASFLLSAGIGLQLWFYRGKSDVATIIAAALLGTPSEIICVHYGVWTYAAPGLVLGIPIWIPLVWGYLFCLFRRLSITACDIMALVSNKKLVNVSIIVLGALILIYFIATIMVIKKEIAIVYTAFMIPAILFGRKDKDILIFIIAGILGTLGEYISMNLGYWRYHFPYLTSIGLPISLPLAWGLSGVIIARIAGVWDKGGFLNEQR